jgi:hypothetical protein
MAAYSLGLMEHLSGRVAFSQRGEHLDIIECVAPTAHDRQKFLVGAEALHGDVKFVGDLRLDIGPGRRTAPAH